MENMELLWEIFSPYTQKVELKKKEIILREGVVSDSIFYVESGCLRSWFNKDGNDVSFQFFLEGTVVASFESLWFGDPSPYNIESVLPTTLSVIPISVFNAKLEESSELKEIIFKHLCHRVRHYQRLFLSRIKDSPQERYEDLIRNNPEIIRQIPQHYIASYLGVTSVSLSRIRCRK
ncbi:Crp/Fnr family transcriptional regulator [Vibrio sp. Isolate22]|uniref:Crp/Fnr family transcriptional regulator n=1 Tax=Vibrio sp. Isolate22 TaxID=2908532 RepID=UPI001EFC6655|nr:Crp/Fnr family transcriptional regulator [Vibrio sp. Isolate22]MCG9692591.1 Crp/Fnr family transcriptional regulator [Vibrio sp. Isolate22]